MKLYTQPRPLVVGLLRRGDQLALRPDGRPIQRDAEYIDHDLRGKVLWTTVVSDLLPAIAGDPETVKVRHAHGEVVAPLSGHVITREVIELDPWTYVERRGERDRSPWQGGEPHQSADPRDQLPTREVRRPE